MWGIDIILIVTLEPHRHQSPVEQNITQVTLRFDGYRIQFGSRLFPVCQYGHSPLV